MNKLLLDPGIKTKYPFVQRGRKGVPSAVPPQFAGLPAGALSPWRVEDESSTFLSSIDQGYAITGLPVPVYSLHTVAKNNLRQRPISSASDPGDIQR